MVYGLRGNYATSGQRCVSIDGGTLCICIPQAQILLDHVYDIKCDLASLSAQWTFPISSSDKTVLDEYAIF